MNLRLLFAKLASCLRKETANGDDEMDQSLRALLASFSSNAFVVNNGALKTLAMSGGQAIFQRGSMMIRATNDRHTMLFDAAYAAEPERWYLFTIVKGVLERAPLADDAEPTNSDVAKFVNERIGDLDHFFSPEQWPRSRAALCEREQAQSVFMRNLLRR